MRAGAALVLEREFGQGMSAAVTAPLGTVYADPSKQHRIEVMLAVARRTDAEYDQLPEPAAIPGVEWVEEDRLLPYLCSGRIADTTSAAAIAVLQACGELVR